MGCTLHERYCHFGAWIFQMNLLDIKFWIKNGNVQFWMTGWIYTAIFRDGKCHGRNFSDNNGINLKGNSHKKNNYIVSFGDDFQRSNTKSIHMSAPDKTSSDGIAAM